MIRKTIKQSESTRAVEKEELVSGGERLSLAQATVTAATTTAAAAIVITAAAAAAQNQS